MGRPRASGSPPWWRRAWAAMRRFVAELVRRCRERGRTALLRALRITGATVAAFVVAELVGLHGPAPAGRRADRAAGGAGDAGEHAVNGVQRVLSVVLGVVVAVGFVSVVGLNWWSLGIVVAASIIGGQILRLGPHLLEVPISAMLVLGVGLRVRRRVGGARPDHRDARRRGGRRARQRRVPACGADPFRRTGGREVRGGDRGPARRGGGGDGRRPRRRVHGRALAGERAAAQPPCAPGRPRTGGGRREPQAERARDRRAAGRAQPA